MVGSFVCTELPAGHGWIGEKSVLNICWSSLFDNDGEFVSEMRLLDLRIVHNRFYMVFHFDMLLRSILWFKIKTNSLPRFVFIQISTSESSDDNLAWQPCSGNETNFISQQCCWRNLGREPWFLAAGLVGADFFWLIFGNMSSHPTWILYIVVFYLFFCESSMAFSCAEFQKWWRQELKLNPLPKMFELCELGNGFWVVCW